MLKTMLLTHDNVDISSYAIVQSFMKQNSKGHIPKQAKIFTIEEIKRFLLNAPDDNYLAYKVCTYY
jgi:hypothetical protein